MLIMNSSHPMNPSLFTSALSMIESNSLPVNDWIPKSNKADYSPTLLIFPFPSLSKCLNICAR